MSYFRLIVRGLAALALAALVFAAIPSTRALQADAAAPAGGAFDTTVLDRTCKACDDFWGFATGGWRKRTKLPAGYSEWGTFNEIAQRNQLALRSVLDTAAADSAAPAGSEEQQIGTFYKACLDQAAINARGFEALQPALDDINAVNSTPALVAEIGKLQRMGVDVGLPFGSETDAKNSAITIGAVGYGGMGMPSREEYLDAGNAAHRTAYLAYMTKQFKNAGEDAAAASDEARKILALETTFATVTPAKADLRDPLATYHPMAVTKLPAIAPHIAWNAFFASYGHPNIKSVDLNLPKYMAAYDADLVSTPLSTWKAYLRVHLFTAYASALPKRFDDADFAFFSTTLNGVKSQRDRWKRCISSTDSDLTDPLGKTYVAKMFSPEAKERAVNLVNNLQGVLHDDISTLAWMSPATRKQAEIKLAAYSKKVGYPNTWIDYSSVNVAPSATYLDDRMASQRFATRRDLARIDKPTDRTIWGDSPPTVNAYYDPSNNEILFPAGILQSPFFNEHADDALNYGAIGAIIGHEMTHGFDDQGRQYDAHGNLRNWWTASDAKNFASRAQCIVDQFNGYKLAGTHENGRLVQGEAIADLGGATIAFRAFERTPEFKANTTIDGFTPAQRFFLAYAQVWRDIITAQAQAQYVLIDPHPDNQFRVIGTLGNMPEFQAAFACARTDAMIRKDRCQIW